MPQSKILLDSNSYFRLAKSIHPLLDVIFGDDDYCLYVLKELDDEFAGNKRLQTQFAWVEEEGYAANRKKRLTLSRQDRKNINLTVEFLREHKMENALGISNVDILGLAYGHVLNIPVVTDDADMLQCADDFNIRTMKTLELLQLMMASGHVDMQKIRQIASFWEYIYDKPGNFRSDYIRIFGEAPP